MRIAITRGVSPRIERCELTHLERETINVNLANEQHNQYEECLTELGCEVRSLPAEPDLPDSVFVEDTAIVVEELAVITRPGAESRRPEVSGIAEVLGEYRRLVYIVEPGTIDGGDVLVLDHDVYIGQSGRTNEEGVRQVRAMLTPLGYTVIGLPVKACLHLKSAVGRVAPDTLLINRQWVNSTVFGGMKFIDVDPAEPGAAGALLIRDTVIYPARFERTRERLDRAGIKNVVVNLSELAKAEAGVTCSSIVFEK